MNANRWNYIKNLKPAAPRMTHVSKRFMRNPLSIAAESAGQPYFGPEFVALPGETFNVGRNVSKRQLRNGLPRKFWPVAAPSNIFIGAEEIREAA